MSWALLVYAIDVLSTNGRYFGWAILFVISLLAYLTLRVQIACEQEQANAPQYTFTVGKHLTLVKPWNGFKEGQELVVMEIYDRDANRVKVRDPNGSPTSYLNRHDLKAVIAPDTAPKQVRDVFKPVRRLFMAFMIICGLGIGYANFMPSQNTAYKMLAAYVGQTVVETPEVRETAGNAIDFLNKAIKTYSDKLDAEAVPAKPAKEGAK